MRNLSSTLLATQKKSARRPYVKVSAVDRIGGITRFNWYSAYEGEEDDHFHAAACPGDGSLIRLRVDPADNKLYRQKSE